MEDVSSGPQKSRWGCCQSGWNLPELTDHLLFRIARVPTAPPSPTRSPSAKPTPGAPGGPGSPSMEADVHRGPLGSGLTLRLPRHPAPVRGSLTNTSPLVELDLKCRFLGLLLKLCCRYGGRSRGFHAWGSQATGEMCFLHVNVSAHMWPHLLAESASSLSLLLLRHGAPRPLAFPAHRVPSPACSAPAGSARSIPAPGPSPLSPTSSCHSITATARLVQTQGWSCVSLTPPPRAGRSARDTYSWI